MKRLTVALLTALSSTTLLAAEKPYIGIDYQMGTYTQNNTDVNPEAFRLRAGTEINRYLAVEAQAGLGTASDTYKVTGGQVDIKVDSFYSLFLRPQLNLTNTVSVYGLVGGTYIDVSSTSSIPQNNDSGFTHTTSYGAGLDFTIKNGIRLGADFIQYMDNYSAVSVGIRIPIH
ncbi:MAG: porin family protein [Moraxellaceae bacterium]|nr:porin family protein [Moraxellaceae bacterium]